MGNIIEATETRHPQLGGKAGALAALQDAGVLIPPWFVVSPQAFSPKADLLARGGILQYRAEDLMEDAVREDIERAIAQLCPHGELVAVRSSAIEEDSAEHSFAGQLESFLFVPPAEVPQKVVEVWKSGFSDRVLAYCRERNLGAPQAPAVLVQRMVNPEVAGVAFGADPVSGRRGVAIVSAVYGLGTALVSGECDADTYEVDRRGNILKRAIARKTTAHHSGENGAGVVATPVAEDRANQPALGDDRIGAVAKLVRQLGQHFHRPQDIEWAIADDKLYLLQSRPITSLTTLPDSDGALNLWDNSNIAESYGGVTTPLTFSFARRAYEEVYKQFCKLMGVPRETIAQNRVTFSRMLGLIRGRVYYNLLSWYRVLATLPGFTVNRRFMEQMMGVKEPLSEEILAQIQPPSSPNRLQDALRLSGTIVGLFVNYFRLPANIKRFYLRLDRALNTPLPAPPKSLRADELAAYYRDLEHQLLTRWDAPLVNDFFAMIFYGVLRKLTENWCGDGEGTLQNDLISGEGGMISAEPAKRVKEMAEIARENSPLPALLCEGSLAEILRGIKQWPQFREKYEEYLAKFGDRCMDELKLESSTLHDDPLPLLRAVGHLSRSAAKHQPPPTDAPLSPRCAAEAKVKEALHSHKLRQILFAWVLKNARNRVRDRENLRFERTRLFGRVRRIFLEIGKRFYAEELLAETRDIFYLEVNEILGYIEGTSTTTNLKGLVALRQQEFATYQDSPPPGDRFETRGIVYLGNPFSAPLPNLTLNGETLPQNTGDSHQGLGCCPGIVRGKVQVVSNPKNAVLESGSILVAERTDPGWIMLFPAASGLLVERGSLLSHSAIVAREMGIPAIVSLAGVTQWLTDGDWVEMDGSSGIVRKIPPEL